MGPISNDMLVHLLKHRIARANIGLAIIAEQIQCEEADLRGFLDKKSFATPKLLARLALAFGSEWKTIALKYMEWRFDHELEKVGKPDAKPNRPINLFQQLSAAQQFIIQNPMMGAAELTEIIKGSLHLDEPVIRNQIAHVRSQQTGDYRFYG